MSQSPQAGQFNSYKYSWNPKKKVSPVSIPSSGSIQFLPKGTEDEMMELGWVSIPSSGSIQFLQRLVQLS